MVVGDGRAHAEGAVRQAKGAGEGARLLHREPFRALNIVVTGLFLALRGFDSA